MKESKSKIDSSEPDACYMHLVKKIFAARTGGENKTE